VKHLSPLNMVLNSIMNLVLEKLPSDPAVATQGRIYYNTTNNIVRFANGTVWADLGSHMTGGEILAALLAVDGAGSSLDADLLDGMEASAFALASHTHAAADITDLVGVIDSRVMAAFTNSAVDATVDTIAEFTQLIKDNQGDIANILSIKRHDELLGANVLSTVTHNLNTLNAVVQIVEVATGETVIADVLRTGVNTIDVSFQIAPAANAYKAIILA